jgi:ribosomal protein S11
MTHFDSNEVEPFQIDPQRLLQALLSGPEEGAESPSHSSDRSRAKVRAAENRTVVPDERVRGRKRRRRGR